MKYSSRLYIFPLLCILTGVAFQYTGLDISLESVFYDSQQHGWPWKDAWLTQSLLHKGGHHVVVLIITAIIVIFIASLFHSKMNTYRRPAGFLLLSSLTGVGIVGALKASTHMYTPWALQEFGGKLPNIRLFDEALNNLPIGHAFPSGHASSGFALLSFYFLARHYQHRLSTHFLSTALLIGFIFGVGQQMRGAHMISHDMFALSICWVSCLAWSKIIFPATQSVADSDFEESQFQIQHTS